MKIRQDLLGNIPNIGDLIGFNPPQNSGLIYGTCIGFTRVGLPKVNNLNNGSSYLKYLVKRQGYYTPKTGFFIVNKINSVDNVIIDNNELLSATEFINEYLGNVDDNLSLTILMKKFAEYHFNNMLEEILKLDLQGRAAPFIRLMLEKAYSINNIKE